MQVRSITNDLFKRARQSFSRFHGDSDCPLSLNRTLRLKRVFQQPVKSAFPVIALLLAWETPAVAEAPSVPVMVGVAERDITPQEPVLAFGYGYRHPTEKVDSKLKATAIAIGDSAALKLVIVGVDTALVPRPLIDSICNVLVQPGKLQRDQIMLVASHTHSGPMLPVDAGDSRISRKAWTQNLSSAQQEAITRYGDLFQKSVIEAVRQAVSSMAPSLLEYGRGSARFAINRRAFRADGSVAIADNPDGPVVYDVPVLKIMSSSGEVKGIMFGYAAHPNSLAILKDGKGVISGDYPSHARELIEAVYPGVVATFVPGFQGDINPSPGVGSTPPPTGHDGVLAAARHGLELAGAVIGVLDRKMKPIGGGMEYRHAKVELPLEGQPTLKAVRADSASKDPLAVERARHYLAMAKAGQPFPRSVSLRLGSLKIGDDFILYAAGGEITTDYALRLKRESPVLDPWLIGYAYEVPSYIPSARLLKEGGYEAGELSLKALGLYGRYDPSIENIIVEALIGK